MLKTTASRLALVLVAGFAAATLPTLSSTAGVIPLKNAAMIDKKGGGYLYRAGQQNSHLTVSRVSGGLKFVDTGTRELRRIPSSCHRISVSGGIGAICSAGGASANHPMKLQIWPRLGDDYINASSLSSAFKLSVLADAGRDTVYGGAGNDFVNGAQDGDRVYGGGGKDWIRTGIGNDSISGGSGNDKLVGVEGSDTVRGGDGNDYVYGGDGSDHVYGDGGTDRVSCGGGHDRGYGGRSDKMYECEAVTRSGS